MDKALKKAKQDFLAVLKRNGIKKKIVDVYDSLDQEDFFDSIFIKDFYSNRSIPLGEGELGDPGVDAAQLISVMAPKSDWRVLEIGTGSGYSTAVLSSLCKEVISIEYHEKLALKAKSRLLKYNVDNVRYFCGEGTDYKQPLGVFDAVIVWGACQKRPLSLLANLKPAGTLVFPMGPVHQQQITTLVNKPDEKRNELCQTNFYNYCTFPLVRGRYGSDLISYLAITEES